MNDLSIIKTVAKIKRQRANRFINPLFPIIIDQTLLRFYAKIKIKPGPLKSPCHIWQANHSGKGRGGGYSRFTENGKTIAGHIYIFQKHGGIRLPNHQLDHLCNNRMCVNPHHLEQVTAATNQQRKYARKAG